MAYVNNMFFKKDLVLSSHRSNIQYKIHISCNMALMKWKPTAGTFLWSRLCKINAFWRSHFNSILDFINQSLIDKIYHHFHWTLFKVSNNKEQSVPRREDWITWYRTRLQVFITCWEHFSLGCLMFKKYFLLANNEKLIYEILNHNLIWSMFLMGW